MLLCFKVIVKIKESMFIENSALYLAPSGCSIIVNTLSNTHLLSIHCVPSTIIIFYLFIF